MSPIERTNSFSKAPPLPPYESQRAKEGNMLQRLNTAVGDMRRDIDTASNMAKDKFDGDDALLRIGRGGLTTLIGYSLENAIRNTFDKGFQGLDRFLERPPIKIDPQALTALENAGTKFPPLYHFAREGARDILTGVIFNGLAFFSRPMLPSIEGKHLVRSAFVNALESVIEDPTVIRENIEQAAANRKDGTAEANKIMGEVPQTERAEWRDKTLKVLGASNPATQLGVDMMISGVKTLLTNFKEVRKVRKEKGGLEGKPVYMPKKQWGREEPHNQHKDAKVYYGKSSWAKPKEEEEIEKFM